MKHILFCKTCKKFTMKDTCTCGGKAETTKPAKYSPDDKYADYKRKAKEEGRKKEGLL